MKPCPFCATDETQVVSWLVAGVGEHREYAVTCRNCGSQGPNDLSESSAIGMWDMRRTQADLERELAFTRQQLAIATEQVAAYIPIAQEAAELRAALEPLATLGYPPDWCPDDELLLDEYALKAGDVRRAWRVLGRGK